VNWGPGRVALLLLQRILGRGADGLAGAVVVVVCGIWLGLLLLVGGEWAWGCGRGSWGMEYVGKIGEREGGRGREGERDRREGEGERRRSQQLHSGVDMGHVAGARVPVPHHPCIPAPGFLFLFRS
jgi:hypothetical protein